jgi:hypothetical protein
LARFDVCLLCGEPAGRTDGHLLANKLFGSAAVHASKGDEAGRITALLDGGDGHRFSARQADGIFTSVERIEQELLVLRHLTCLMSG